MSSVSDAGLLAIMLVDVEGSTALATRAGDEVAQRVLAETKELVRDRAEARGGRQIDAVGDAMMLTFASARAAIVAATEVQETIAEREGAQPDETVAREDRDQRRRGARARRPSVRRVGQRRSPGDGAGGRRGDLRLGAGAGIGGDDPRPDLQGSRSAHVQGVRRALAPVPGRVAGSAAPAPA